MLKGRDEPSFDSVADFIKVRQAIVRDMYLLLRSTYTECVLHYLEHLNVFKTGGRGRL